MFHCGPTQKKICIRPYDEAEWASKIVRRGIQVSGGWFAFQSNRQPGMTL